MYQTGLQWQVFPPGNPLNNMGLISIIMLGNYYCQICGNTHADWERMNELLFCRNCKSWKSTRRFNIPEPSKGVYVDSDSYFYYDVPTEVSDDALSIHDNNKNMMDWNNIGLTKESVKWINESLINKEQYVRFVIMEFYIGRDTFSDRW